jgi:hypothetical protein
MSSRAPPASARDRVGECPVALFSLNHDAQLLSAPTGGPVRSDSGKISQDGIQNSIGFDTQWLGPVHSVQMITIDANPIEF